MSRAQMKKKKQASSNQPPSSPYRWDWDQRSGLAETLDPPYASGKAQKHMVHPPSTAVSMTLSKTSSNRCQNMLTPKWHRLCWKTMEYTHASAHNVGAEVGQRRGRCKQRRETGLFSFFYTKFLFPPIFLYQPPWTKWKRQLLSWQPGLSSFPIILASSAWLLSWRLFRWIPI